MSQYPSEAESNFRSALRTSANVAQSDAPAHRLSGPSTLLPSPTTVVLPRSSQPSSTSREVAVPSRYDVSALPRPSTNFSGRVPSADPTRTSTAPSTSHAAFGAAHVVPRTFVYDDSAAPVSAPRVAPVAPAPPPSMLRPTAADHGGGPPRATSIPLRPEKTMRDDSPNVGELPLPGQQRLPLVAPVPTARVGGAAPSQGPFPPDAGKSIPQEVFYQELLLMWLGPLADSPSCAWDSDASKFVLRGGSERQRSMFDTLEPCGSFCRLIKEHMAKATMTQSFVQQSLHRAMSQQITEYEAFVGRYRSLAHITAADVSIAYQTAIPKLSIMHHILKDTERAKGGELVTRLQFLTHQGSAELGSFLEGVYRDAVKPLLRMTQQWITRGEAPDPYHEFFVSSKLVNEAESNYWRDRFTLRPAMRPVTFTERQTEQILMIGKNINFIRNCCHVRDWRMRPDIAAAALSVGFGDIDGVLATALDFTNDSIVRVLNTTFKLPQMFALARSLLLLAQGDLFDGLVVRLESALTPKKTRQQQIAASGDALHASLSESAHQLTDVDVNALPHVTVGIDNNDAASSGGDGWGGFFIKLPVVAPLNNVLPEATMARYRRLFQLLIKVKRAEVGLKHVWHHTFGLNRAIQRCPEETRDELRAAAGLAHLVGLELTHFVKNFQSYVMTEAIGVAWDTFQSRLSSPSTRSLDDIVEAHEAYLDALMQFTLLDPRFEVPKKFVDTVLSAAIEFSLTHGDLTGNIDKSSLPLLHLRFQRIADTVRTHVTGLLSSLETDHMTLDFLQSLGSRINFNSFYHADPSLVPNQY